MVAPADRPSSSTTMTSTGRGNSRRPSRPILSDPSTATHRRRLLLPIGSNISIFLTTTLLLLLPTFIHSQTFSCTDIVAWASADRSGDHTSSALTFTDPGDDSETRTITLTNTAATNQLCTLFQITTSDDGLKRFYVPVGRSYDGNDWERVAGRHSDLTYTCAGAGSCDVTLPFDPVTPTNTEYYMAAFKYDLTGPQKFARFLERATFGGRSADITAKTGSTAEMSNFLELQFDMDPTSHREYYRKRLNPRRIELYKNGRTGPPPCEAGSKWRSFAFTSTDKVMSTGTISSYWPMVMHFVTLETRTFNGVDKFAWLYDGHLRTILDARPQWSDGSSSSGTGDIPDGEYKLCGVDEAPGSLFDDANEEKRTLYAKFLLEDPTNGDSCTTVFGGNPDVALHPDYFDGGPDDGYLLTISDPLEPIGYDPTGIGGVGHGTDKTSSATVRLNNNAITDAICADLPDPNKADYRSKGWEYSPYYEGRKHPNWDPASRSYLDPTVFAYDSTNQVYLIHDRRFTPLENTLANPLPDGGGDQTLESVWQDINFKDEVDGTRLIPQDLEIVDVDENPRTASSISGEEQAIYCSNTKPNIFNEEFCQLSIEPNACVREGKDDEDTIVVVTLDDTSLTAFNGHLVNTTDQLIAVGHPVIVHGLGFEGDDGELGSKFPYPCVMEAVSRWKKLDAIVDETACGNAVNESVGASTKAAFRHLFQYSVSNNDVLRDVRMYQAFENMACETVDLEKYGFTIWDEVESLCYENIHPQEFNVHLITDSTGAFAHCDASNCADGKMDVSSIRATWETTYTNPGPLWGRKGDRVPLLPLLNELGIYTLAGGLAQTAAPTSTPSAAPTSTPSLSIVPTSSKFPTADSGSPSISAGPSLKPSTSLVPSASSVPSSQPSSQPSSMPSISSAPSESDPIPSAMPSSVPSVTLSSNPSISINSPTSVPSVSTMPSDIPSRSGAPTLAPSQYSQVARTFTDNTFEAIVNDPDIAQVILETQHTQKTGGVLVCGSIGEIAPDPEEDDYFDYWNYVLDSINVSQQKKTVWTNVALTAEDQLCQRTSWALSQIFQIAPALLPKSSTSEMFTNYYDGFVRNCNSSYKNVMKTIAFSVNMGRQLSIVGSTAIRTSLDGGGQIRLPDENYAREAMQLETVGLDMLNMDGTQVLDDLGVRVPTYDTNDILTFARVWTGFELAARRGNYEEWAQNTKNWNDPMNLVDADRHDWFPKKDLIDDWIGDQYPLCYDMPEKAFLKKGATYKLLGRSSSPRYQYDTPDWDGNEKVKRMTLRTSSSLYDALCAADNNSECTFPTVVELQDDISCNGLECNVDTLRVVQVTQDVFYEYVRRPCVHLAFSDDFKTVFAGGWRGAKMCAHQSQPVATTTCCPGGGDSSISCFYHGEKVTYDKNLETCGSDNLCPGEKDNVNNDDGCPGQIAYRVGQPKENHFQWTSGTCKVKVKVRLDAMVALVHIPQPENNNDRVVQYVMKSAQNNMNFFHIPWPRDVLNDELFPHIDNGCGEGTCIEQDDWTCLCDVTLTNNAGFTADPNDEDDIRSTLKVGAFPPEYLGGYDTGSVILGTVTVYHKTAIGGYSEDTIFRLIDETDQFVDFGDEYVKDSNPLVGYVYLKNLKSEIQIGDPSNDFYSQPGRVPLIMRNPVMFHDLVDPEIRDAHYEIDAVIHHLTSHQNAAPFISHQLIQHFGIANPSPGYIERVATAYREGVFTSDSIVFGDGKFSDLNAVVAAILLDQEATASTLDADPAYGGIKEPIIKVLQFMRAMEYKQTPHDRNSYPKFSNMVAKVGQMGHESPDQFSFFLPDYSPPGQFAVGGLFAPPAQVLTLSTTIATVEGFFSLARHGLSAAAGGFGQNVFGGGVPDPGDTSQSVGYLSFSSNGSTNQEKVQEIADLLTGGRLSPAAVTRIANEATVDVDKFAQQMIATTPEFHTTNLAERTGNERTPTPKRERAPEPYKAIVIVFASGGLDSFNLLTPHTTCDLYKSYRSVRQGLSLIDREMVRITNTNPDQPCSDFGVHKRIEVFKTIYDDGYGQFHANIGHLAKPVTKGNWFTETRTHLFSHTTMGVEAQLVDAFQEDGWSTGVGGRMLDVLQRQDLSVNAIGIDGKGFIIEGNPSLGRTVDVVPSGGVNLLERISLSDNNNDLASIEPLMEYLNEETSLETSGVFANYWSQNLVDVLNKTDELSTMVSGVQLNVAFNGCGICRQLSMVAKMMHVNEQRNVNRDVFFISNGGHDGHAESKTTMSNLLGDLNNGITSFYNEMVASDMLDDVTFVFMSEFGRTLSENTGKGSDHAWGGNAFVWGGQIDGSKILGQYLTTFDNTEIHNIGGRLIPNRSWESMWYGISNWFGITDEADMKYVLPNNGNMGCQLYTDTDMYTVGNTTIGGCNDQTVGISLSMLLNEPRYLTGIEQKRICQAAIYMTVQNANTTSRCVVTDQKVIIYYDVNRRRMLSAEEMDGRLLETDGIENITIEATIDFPFDNPNGTTAGNDYIADTEQMTADLNSLIVNGTDCGESNSTRRRLDGGTCITFELGIVNEVTSFEVIELPSLSPSTSFQPSDQPSQNPSTSTQPSGQPSESPSGQPSNTPSEVPSGQPSEVPSGQPSNTPSEVPSGQQSESPSGQPSNTPSEVPSGQPSMTPSEYPSNQPSEVPSGQPSIPPSEYPSSQPSEAPTGRPSNKPSQHPSISQHPSTKPSFEPTISQSPTVPQPSAKPSVAPSSRPSKLCPRPDGLDESQQWPPECRYGGMWSIYSCQCLCVSPFCPSAVEERCQQRTTCPADYYETLFDDEPEPWFNFGNSCTAHKELPSGVKAIYSSKEDCCETEYSTNSGACVQRPAAIMELAFHGKLQLVGVNCPNSGSERTAAVGIASRSILSTLCSIPGVKCDSNTKLKVTKFCGHEFDIIAKYSPGSRRLQAPDELDNDIVEFTLYMESFDQETLKTIEALLSAYLQGSTLTAFLSDVLDDVSASNPPPSLQQLSAASFTAVAAFIRGLGLYYPAWGYAETCLSDGGQEEYMNRNNGGWLFETLELCCERYYGWDAVGCRTRNAETTLVSGTIPSTYDPTDKLYFPDWTGVDTCINDGTALPYMKKNPDLWMYTTLRDCCQAYYGWEEGFEKCMSLQGGDPPTRSPITETWYVDWKNFVCVESCEGEAPCGGVHQPWDILHDSKSSCCEAHLWWTEDCIAL